MADKGKGQGVRFLLEEVGLGRDKPGVFRMRPVKETPLNLLDVMSAACGVKQ